MSDTMTAGLSCPVATVFYSVLAVFLFEGLLRHPVQADSLVHAAFLSGSAVKHNFASLNIAFTKWLGIPRLIGEHRERYLHVSAC